MDKELAHGFGCWSLAWEWAWLEYLAPSLLAQTGDSS